MIVYASTKAGFQDDVHSNRIDDKILGAFRVGFGHGTSKSEIRSWQSSMFYMNGICSDPDIPPDAGVAIEFRIPQTSKRIDFILTGQNEDEKDIALIIELKQWERAEKTDKDGIVSTFINGGPREVSHPSYQAWTYAALLNDFNEAVQDGDIRLNPCAYLHNYRRDKILTDPFYADHVSRAPLFFKEDVVKLQSFIKTFVKYGDKKKILYQIERGRIRPSKSLADKLGSMLKGNQEFVMIDDQKLAYETALALFKESQGKGKQVLIVEGGPGTGKSVVAINLLVAFLKERRNARYVTKNAAPRAVYESLLTGSFKKSQITNLFTGSGAFTETDRNAFDVLLVDEAHRLNEKSGMFQNKGENQIKELIDSAFLSVFFVDENQRVTLKDIGNKDEIKKWAKRAGARITEMALESQFRCNGSNGYLAWLDNTCQIMSTANETLDGLDYDLRVFDDPVEMRKLIERKNKINNKARLVAGYCWDWVSKNSPGSFDIEIPDSGFRARWNLNQDGSLWILKPDSVSEVGCIHTCQGLELDYVGVIIGDDFVVRDGMVVTDSNKRSKMDSSVKGFKKRLKENPDEARSEMDLIIKNTYRTLMTRGARGCYLYCTDSETREYFKQAMDAVSGQETKKTELRILEDVHVPETERFTTALPVYSLAAAAGGFSQEQIIEPLGWGKINSSLRPTKDMFIAQVKGRSMEPTIPDGSYCVFRWNPQGSRNGKVVLVESRLLTDSENGGQYTVKRYQSEIEPFDDGTWRHKQVILAPDNSDFEDIVLREVDADGLRIIAEFIAIV